MSSEISTSNILSTRLRSQRSSTNAQQVQHSVRQSASRPPQPSPKELKVDTKDQFDMRWGLEMNQLVTEGEQLMMKYFMGREEDRYVWKISKKKRELLKETIDELLDKWEVLYTKIEPEPIKIPLRLALVYSKFITIGNQLILENKNVRKMFRARADSQIELEFLQPSQKIAEKMEQLSIEMTEGHQTLMTYLYNQPKIFHLNKTLEKVDEWKNRFHYLMSDICKPNAVPIQEHKDKLSSKASVMFYVLRQIDTMVDALPLFRAASMAVTQAE